MAEDKGDQELESKIEAAVARALESQLPAIVAQLRKERPENRRRQAPEPQGVVSAVILTCNHSPSKG